MAVYYIDPNDGNNLNNGLSEIAPLKSIGGLLLNPGDSVLFKRGSVVRGSLNNTCGSEGKPILYGAYGEGEKPIFCGSVSLNNPEIWTEEAKNIWFTDALDEDEAGNFIFDGGRSCGALRWSKEELCQQGDFFDENAGSCNAGVAVKHRTYLYSHGNPALVYNSIEAALYGKRGLATNGNDMIFENLKFMNSGVHAIAGDKKSRNITIRNCEFEFIGGCVWSREIKVRFGNAVETWDVGENITVTGCRFYDIYDSAVTHQGGDECQPGLNLDFSDNVFAKCGMAAFELRDRMPINSKFNNNICIDAGLGFSGLGEEMPRYSEIWPQPMGHHLFLWRVENPAEGGSLEVKNNIFCNAPYGAAIYSIISEDAEKQIDFEGNTYYTENPDLLNRLHGKNYRTFDEYKEKSAVYKTRKELEL